MPRKSTKGKADGDTEEIRAQVAALSREQMLAIARYVPAPDRWVANHRWMSQAESARKEQQLWDTSMWTSKAREAGPECPGRSSLNMLRFALDDPKAFWASYWKKCDEALRRAEKHKLASAKQQDKPEKLDELRASLDSYLAHHNLRLKDAPPEWYSPPNPTPVVS